MGSERQWVTIARGLVNAPALFLADKPMGNPDSRTGGEVMEFLARMNEGQGLTVLVASHALAAVAFAH